MVAVMLEHGPFTFDLYEESLNEEKNMYRWNSFAHVLYIDTPVGAGFSYGDLVKDPITGKFKHMPTTAVGAMDEVYQGLKLFFAHQQFKKYATCDVFVAGESYGGKYTLALSAIIDRENNLNNTQNHINLKGLIMANAWVHPDVHERTYGELGYSNGMLDYNAYVMLNNKSNTCHKLVMDEQYERAELEVCGPAYSYNMLEANGRLPIRFNTYDMRDIGDMPYSVLYPFMNSDEVRSALSIDSSEDFSVCGDGLFAQFRGEFQKSYIDMVPPLLAKYKFLIYNGQYDIRCSVLGTNEWLRLLEWDGRHTFNNMEHELFSINGRVKGTFKHHKNLNYLIVYGAGHLAPYDQPETVFAGVKQFVTTLSLCNDTQCAQQGKCPDSCSKRGKCENGVCKCNRGFQGENCSIAKHDVIIGRTKTFQGYIFGNDMNVYHLSVPQRQTTLFDLHLRIAKKSESGKLHLYVHGGTEFVKPNEVDVSSIRRLFLYQSLEDTDSRTLYLNELSRSNNTHLTVLVLNTVDVECDYSLDLSTDISGKRYDTALAGSIFLFCTMTVFAIVLAVVLVGQYQADKKYYRYKPYATGERLLDLDLDTFDD